MLALQRVVSAHIHSHYRRASLAIGISLFVDWEKVEFGKATDAQSKIKQALEKFIDKAVDWADEASGVLDAIAKIGPQSGKCDVELIYECVVIDPGDSNLKMGTVLQTKVVTLSLGTDADATDFQNSNDAPFRAIWNKPRGEFTPAERQTFWEWQKLIKRYMPHPRVCACSSRKSI